MGSGSHYSRRAARSFEWGCVLLAACFFSAPWAYYYALRPGSPWLVVLFAALAVLSACLGIKFLREARRCYQNHLYLYCNPSKK